MEIYHPFSKIDHFFEIVFSILPYQIIKKYKNQSNRWHQIGIYSASASTYLARNNWPKRTIRHKTIIQKAENELSHKKRKLIATRKLIAARKLFAERNYLAPPHCAESRKINWKWTNLKKPVETLEIHKKIFWDV